MPESQLPPTTLERSIYATVHYFSLFEMPLTITQIWQGVIRLPNSEARDSRTHLHWRDIHSTLHSSDWLHSRLDNKWGYYFIARQEKTIDSRLRRYIVAAEKWQTFTPLARVLSVMPFVRMIGVTGSLALHNTTASSDFDVLIVAERGRIWTTRLLLLLVSQLLGRRRTHWDRKAPDKVCLNHYLGSASLVIEPANRNLYTAFLYSRMLPLYGRKFYRAFLEANREWLDQFVQVPEATLLPPVQAISLSRVEKFIKRLGEVMLAGWVGNVMERAAGWLQRRVAGRHMQPQRAGRVVLTNTELAFHPDSKAQLVTQWWQQNYAKRS